MLAYRFGLGFPAVPLYADHFGPILDPDKQKAAEKYDEKKSTPLRWDLRTTTMYVPKPKGVSIHSDKTDPSPLVDKRMSINADAMRKLPGRKVWMVPTYATHEQYIRSRQIHATFYLDWEPIDLGRAHPKGMGFPLVDTIHPANTGGLQKSLLIAREVKRLLDGR